MTITDWLYSPWPYVYILGTIVALSIAWAWNRHDEDKAEAKDRHPSRGPLTELAAYDPANGEWFDG